MLLPFVDIYCCDFTTYNLADCEGRIFIWPDVFPSGAISEQKRPSCLCQQWLAAIWALPHSVDAYCIYRGGVALLYQELVYRLGVGYRVVDGQALGDKGLVVEDCGECVNFVGIAFLERLLHGAEHGVLGV